MGVPFNDLIVRSTVNPAREIHRPDLGTLSIGKEADIAVLEELHGKFSFIDCGYARLDGDSRIVARMTIRAGRILYDPEMVTSTDAGSPIPHLAIPATALAKAHFNNALFANSIMLGALTALAGFDAEAVRSAMLEVLPRFQAQNVRGLELGREVVGAVEKRAPAAAAGDPGATRSP